MITLTKQIPVTNNIPNIVKLEVVDVHDYANQAPPYLIVNVTLYGSGSVAFGTYNILIYDELASTVLSANPAPQQITDQFIPESTILDGTPYTTLAALWNGPTTPATRAGRLKAVEDALIAAGALSPDFAGS